jgi:hypothetical protein
MTTKVSARHFSSYRRVFPQPVSASVVQGLWQRIPVATLVMLALIDAVLLATALLIMISGSRALRFDRADESAIVFCGSQKSVVSGIPIASALIAGPALGLFVLPIMMYHSMQLLVCAWLAKRYASRSHSAPGSQDNYQVLTRPDLQASSRACVQLRSERSTRLPRPKRVILTHMGQKTLSIGGA